MNLATKLGLFSIIQDQPPDDGDPAVYHVLSPVREDLEKLLHATGLQREILVPRDVTCNFSIVVTQRDILDIMNALAETIDYSNFAPKKPA